MILKPLFILSQTLVSPSNLDYAGLTDNYEFLGMIDISKKNKRS